MAIVFATGFETPSFLADGLTNNGGTLGQSTNQARTGAWSMRCNPASGGSGSFYWSAASAFKYYHFSIYIATLPSLQRLMFGIIAAGTINVRLENTGALSVYLNTTLLGTSAPLTTNMWHWIGIRQIAGGGTVVWLQVNGADAVSATATVTASNGLIGFSGTEASAVDMYFDDMIVDDSTFLPPSRVGLLLPVSDNAVGSGWTLGTGTAISANGFEAVNNTPPVGVADLAAGSDPKQIRNAAAAANSNYDANMTTYNAIGVGPNDTLLAVQPVVATAAPVVTSAKAGTVGVASNPTIANIALGAGGTPGAFWSGAGGGNYTTGWKVSFGTMTTAPTVTLTTAPVMRITQVTSSTRIAVVCFMAIVVAWTPAVIPYRNPMPPLIAQ